MSRLLCFKVFLLSFQRKIQLLFYFPVSITKLSLNTTCQRTLLFIWIPIAVSSSRVWESWWYNLQSFDYWCKAKHGEFFQSSANHDGEVISTVTFRRTFKLGLSIRAQNNHDKHNALSSRNHLEAVQKRERSWTEESQVIIIVHDVIINCDNVGRESISNTMS